MRPPVRDPSERPSGGWSLVVNGQAFDVARDKLVRQPGGASVASGANSFAGLLACPGPGNGYAGERMGYRAPDIWLGDAVRVSGRRQVEMR